MSYLFSVRGDSMDARTSYNGKSAGQYRGNGSGAGAGPLLGTGGGAGFIGGNYIDLWNNVSQRNGLIYQGGLNLPSGGAWSVVFSAANKVSGQDTCLWSFGNTGAESLGDIQCFLGAGGASTYIKGYDDYGSEFFPQTDTTATMSTDVVYDLTMTYDGATKLEFWKNTTKVASFTTTRAMNNPWQAIKMICIGLVPGIVVSHIWLREFVIANVVLDPTNILLDSGPGALTGASRTSYIATPAVDGMNSTDPGVVNVNSGTSYIINGVGKTGTKITPIAAEVKTGVAFGDAGALTGTYDGSDRWSSPSAGDLRLGTALKNNSLTNNLTGTLVVPSLANTKTGVAGDGGTGTYDGSDRWTAPNASDLRSGTQLKNNSPTLNLTGTLVAPSLANTKVGIAGDGGTGTYDGSDRWTSPLASQLLEGVQLKANSASLNLTGTLHVSVSTDPGVANVLEGVHYTFEDAARIGIKSWTQVAAEVSVLTVSDEESGVVRLIKGEDRTIQFQLKRLDEVAYSLADATEITVKIPTALTILEKKLSLNEVIIEDADGGIMSVTLSDTETSGLNTGDGQNMEIIIDTGTNRRIFPVRKALNVSNQIL